MLDFDREITQVCFENSLVWCLTGINRTILRLIMFIWTRKVVKPTRSSLSLFNVYTMYPVMQWISKFGSMFVKEATSSMAGKNHVIEWHQHHGGIRCPSFLFSIIIKIQQLFTNKSASEGDVESRTTCQMTLNASHPPV